MDVTRLVKMQTCKDCKHWCGMKTSQWGDCQYIIAELQPALLDVVRYDGDNDGEIECKVQFRVPFDPHDVKYWKQIPLLHHLIKALKAEEHEGVRVVERREKDTAFGKEVGTKCTTTTINYIQVRKDMRCEYYGED
jgi:hypothetical protein